MPLRHRAMKRVEEAERKWERNTESNHYLSACPAAYQTRADLLLAAQFPRAVAPPPVERNGKGSRATYTPRPCVLSGEDSRRPGSFHEQMKESGHEVSERCVVSRCGVGHRPKAHWRRPGERESFGDENPGAEPNR